MPFCFIKKYTHTHTNRIKGKQKQIKHFFFQKRERISIYKDEKVYSVLVDDIDDDDELAIVFAVVDEGNPPDLYVSLERLPIHSSQTNVRETSKMRKERQRERESHHFGFVRYERVREAEAKQRK